MILVDTKSLVFASNRNGLLGSGLEESDLCLIKVHFPDNGSV
jgi:hypothetical protein